MANTLTFKTNINCGGCVKAVTPFLNGLDGVEKWEVDTTNENKVLSVQTEVVSSTAIEDAVRKAGFEIEVI